MRASGQQQDTGDAKVQVMSMTRRMPRAIFRAALVCGVVIAAGVVAGAAPATGAAPTEFRLAYTCQFPSGSWQASIQVAAAIPSAGTVGQPIQPTGVHLTMTLPRAAAASLTERRATSVSGSARLAVDIGHDGQSVTATWPLQMPPSTSLRRSAGLTVSASGGVPSVTVSDPGSVAFTAARLALNLVFRRASATSPSPPTVPVTCTPGSRQDTQLADVPVGGTDTATTAPTEPGTGTGITLGPIPGQPSTRSSPESHRHGKFPPGCGDIKKKGNGTPECAYITGYADVLKLHGAALLQPARPQLPGLLNIDLYEHFKIEPGKEVAHSTAELYYRGRHELPPVKATFLAFRFVPVTATMQLTELTPIRIVSVAQVSAPPYRLAVTSVTKVSLHISDVRVNGVSLNVGSHCQTAKPISLKLIGRGTTSPPTGYNLPDGGPLSGTVTIPPFTGCQGSGENLDPLFTGTISGKGNYTLMTQGKLCAPALPSEPGCPPPVRKPLH